MKTYAIVLKKLINKLKVDIENSQTKIIDYNTRQMSVAKFAKDVYLTTFDVILMKHLKKGVQVPYTPSIYIFIDLIKKAELNGGDSYDLDKIADLSIEYAMDIIGDLKVIG